MNCRKLQRLVLTLLVFAGVISITASAQTVNGSLNGTVTDATKAPVAGAAIVVTNDVTKEERKATTQNDGAYAVPQLAPGTYSVTVTKPTFAGQTKSGFQLLVNQAATLDFTLTIGNVTEIVQVEAGATSLNTSNATLGTVIESKDIVDLPLNGRNFTALELLAPGVAAARSSQQGLWENQPGGVETAVSGQRSQANNYTLDGVMNNNIFGSVWAIAPPPDAIQEFNVESHVTDAAFTIAPGANVNITTKQGTNHFHGAAWEFIRNDKLDAYNAFAGRDATGKVLPEPYRQNQYGVIVSGPVFRNKTWFSGYWEGFRSRQANPYQSTVPTAAERTGDFSRLNTQLYNPFINPRTPYTNNQIPVNANATVLLNRFFPLPNFGDVNDPNVANNYRTTISNANNYDQTGIRIDHRFGQNDLLFGRFSRSNDNVLNPDNGLGTNFKNQENYTRAVAVGETHTFGPSTILNLRYGYNQLSSPYSDVPAGDQTYNALTSFNSFFPRTQSLPALAPWLFVGGLPAISQQVITIGPDTTNDFHGDFTMVRGKHTIGVGTLITRFHSFSDVKFVQMYFGSQGTSSNVAATNGTTGNGIASFILGVPSGSSGVSGQSGLLFHTWWYGGYVQDQWQVTSKLTINAGLRYDYVTPPKYEEAGRIVSAFDFYTGQFLVTAPVPPLFPQANAPSGYYYPQRNGWEPRLGLAYRATEKTAIRAGFAIFDDHTNNLIQEGQDPRQGWPQTISPNFSGNDAGIPKYTLSTLPNLQTFNVPAVASYGADPHNKIPYSMEYNFGVEQQIGSTTIFDLDYVGSESRHQFVQPLWNVALKPGQGAAGRPFPSQPAEVNFDTNVGTANYNGLQTKLNKRFAGGFSGLISYTWSKSLDEQSDPQSNSIQNPYNIKGDYGRSDFDVRHLLAISGVYDLPFGKGRQFLSRGKVADEIVGGWSVAPILFFHSGNAFFVHGTYYDAANVGSDNNDQQRPDQIANPYAGVMQNRNHWFNGAAFQSADGQNGRRGPDYGNEQRNTLTGPHYVNMDLDAYKNFAITETLKLQFRTEFFNLFNHVNLGLPAAELRNPGLGIITYQNGNPRQIQFAAKILF